ncbi:MAG: alpha-glucan family phosphorylase [Spirochaetota bacterium]
MQLTNVLVYPRYPESLERLISLAYNLWSMWDGEARSLYRRIDENLYREANNNPVQLLHALPEERISELASDRDFLSEMDRVWRRYQEYAGKGSELGDAFGESTVAYFSMEYGLHASIPVYAGGLGILSGDHLKGASDLGIPLVGVGLYYRNGYFRQHIFADGSQREEYVSNRIYDLALTELKDGQGGPVSITVNIRKQPVRIRVWLARVGRVRLLLLDTGVHDNPPEYRAITENLYDARREVRLMQELVLGFGGVQALHAAGVRPSVFHLNEGHSSFLILQRLKELTGEEKLSLDEARALITATTVFTTHTPVEAGNENYPAEMVTSFLAPEVEALGMSMDRFLSFGSLHNSSTFWLPAFAIRFSRHVNGVSRLHGEVSRRMWKDLFPQRMTCEVPITHITNGVHHSWLGGPMRELLDRHLPPGRLNSADTAGLAEAVDRIPDEQLWEAHCRCKQDMIEYLRDRIEKSFSRRGYAPVNGVRTDRLLDPEVLTVVFARRFTAYKRPTFLLADRDRLKAILTHARRPVQLVFAGKAHPADSLGKGMIKELIDFARSNGLEDRLVFVENYDSLLASYLVQGADVWLNTPLKPFEASGTSGMKAGLNGVLNLSVLDGWWPECYNGRNGWAINSAMTVENREARDAVEAEQVYGLLESEITELYYEHREEAVPRRWVRMMKESLRTVLEGFTINRTLERYVRRFYLPAAREGRRLREEGGREIKELVYRAEQVRKLWDSVRIDRVRTNIKDRDILFAGEEVQVDCEISLDGDSGSLFAVELFSYRHEEDNFSSIPLELSEQQSGRAWFRGGITLRAPGMQGLSLRLVPADEQLRTLHPELVKWFTL